MNVCGNTCHSFATPGAVAAYPHGANPVHSHPHVWSALQHEVYKTAAHEVQRDTSLLVHRVPPSIGTPQAPALQPPPPFVQSTH